MFDMAKGGRAERQDWASNLSIRDDLDAEDICQPWPTLAAECPKDKILALLVEYKDTAQHCYHMKALKYQGEVRYGGRRLSVVYKTHNGEMLTS